MPSACSTAQWVTAVPGRARNARVAVSAYRIKRLERANSIGCTRGGQENQLEVDRARATSYSSGRWSARLGPGCRSTKAAQGRVGRLAKT